MPPVCACTRRHRSAAGKLICGKAVDRHLPEAALPVCGQQLDLHTAVLLRGHQDQILTAAAGDIFHQILLVLLLENGGQSAVLIGIHRQIVVILGSGIAHHQLAAVCILQLSKADVLHRFGKAFHALAHLPASGIIPLQNGYADIGGLGGGIQHRRILLTIAVQVLQHKGRKQLALNGIFQLGALPQPVVQGSLQRAIIAGKLRGTQQFLYLCLFVGRQHGLAAAQHKAQQRAQHQPQPAGSVHTGQPPSGHKKLFSVYHTLRTQKRGWAYAENDLECAAGDYPFRHRLRRCHLPQGDGFSRWRETLRQHRKAPPWGSCRVATEGVAHINKKETTAQSCAMVSLVTVSNSQSRIKRAPELPSQLHRRGERRS